MKAHRRRRLRDRIGGPTTFIGEGCRIDGKLSGTGNYIVCGEVHADCLLDGAVTIAEGGRWHGQLQARSVIVAGSVEGDVVANGRVEIAATARIDGTVTGQAIAVAEGAVIQGAVQTTGAEAPVEFAEKRGDDAEAGAEDAARDRAAS